jgi:dTDP-4-dehydrorhamnose reductase
MEKVLVLGNKGMLGHVLYETFQANDNFKKYDVIGINRSVDNTDSNSFTLDVLKLDELEQFIKNKQPNYIVNCIGSLVEASINRPSLAIQTNSLLPHFLNEISEKYNFKLIHISTDCVFSGRKGAYKVGDLKDGDGYYARSKALGEIDYSNHLTFRTSIVGPELKPGIGLFEWFMKQGGPIKGYVNAFWSGVTTTTLADAIVEAIQVDLSGVYQLTNNQKISKYELLVLFKEVFDKENLQIIAETEKAVDKSLINERNDFDFIVPDYRTALEQMKMWMSESSIRSYHGQ